MPERVTAFAYKGSEMRELAQRIAAIRDHGEAMREYRAELAKYNKRRRGRPEQEVRVRESEFLTRRTLGFTVTHMGKTLTFGRPHKPSPAAWVRVTGLLFLPAQDIGLLANGGKYNRPVLPARVRQYQEAMRAGKWRDLLTDPIAVTADGEVINGQHRLAAASDVDWAEVANDPRFLVLFDVSRDEVFMTDTSRRTGRDMATIAQKSVSGADAA